MATPARLTAAVSTCLAVALVAALPVGGQLGIAALVGLVGLLVLVFGLLSGVPGTITAAAVAFVLQMVILSAVSTGSPLSLWLHTALLVLVVEFATASLSLRDHPSDPVLVATRAIGVAVAAGAVAQAMGLVVAGATSGGVVLRAAGVAAVAVLGGWVALAWRRAGSA